MSIISNFTAEANRLEMLIKYLKSTKKQYSKQELEDVFSPSSARGSSSVFKEVYTVLEALGLIKVDNDSVKLNLPVVKQSILLTIRDAVFNKEFLKRDDFSLTLAWFLTQNSIKSLHWSDNVTNTVSSDLNDDYLELDLTNNSRWQHFGYWCIYLGFATKIYIAEKIDKIILCGGGANLAGLPEYLSFGVKIPAELANVWGNTISFEKTIPEIPFRKSLSYATAVGLAMEK